MEIVFYDLETTGIDHDVDSIISIGAVAVNAKTGKELDSFSAKLKFDPSKASLKALEVNHWSPEAWACAVEPIVARECFRAFLQSHATITTQWYSKAKMGGYNNASFDDQFMKRFFGKDWGRIADYHVVDAMCAAEIASQCGVAFPSLRLQDVAKKLEIKVDEAHEALSDARTAKEVWFKLKAMLMPQNAVDTTIPTGEYIEF